MERFAQSVEYGLDPFRRQRHGERRIRVAPGDDQYGHELAPIGKIDVNVAEVRFAAVSGDVIERDECLPSLQSLDLEMTPDLVVLAAVAVFIY